ncbi:MFS general substrate transporter [Sarocladium strictum]
MDRDIEKDAPERREACKGTEGSAGVLEPRHTTDGAKSRLSTDGQQGETPNDTQGNAGDGSEDSASPQADQKSFEVGWDGGDDDPDCPRSFNTARKWLIVIIVSSCGFCVTAASSAYTSTYISMESDFNNSRIVSVLGLSTYVMGIAVGPMFLSPLSEFYGRRPIYLVSFLLFVIWMIPQAVAHNIATVIVTRFFPGAAGSAFLAVAGGTVGDLFAREQLQAPMSIFTMAPFLAPAIGPMLGGFISYNVSWRWVHYVMIIWGGALYVCLVFLVPETYHPILIKKKAIRLRKETGDKRYHAPNEKEDKSVASAILNSLKRPFQLLIFEYMVLSLCLYSAILLGTLYLFFGAFPLVFGTNHGFNLWQIGLSFMGICVGMVLTLGLDPVWHRIRSKLTRELEEKTGIEGASEPEFRLPPAILGSFFVPIGIFMFGWTSYSSIHWIVPIIGSGIFGAGTILIFTGVLTFLVDAYPTYAASAIAANAFVRCAFAAAFPLFGNQMYNRLGYPWASSLLAFLTLAMLPFPYLFFKYGKSIRARSSYAKS